MRDIGRIQEFFIRDSDDPAKRDMELIHKKCGELACDVEHGDNLAILAEMAMSHVCSSEQSTEG